MLRRPAGINAKGVFLTHKVDFREANIASRLEFTLSVYALILKCGNSSSWEYFVHVEIGFAFILLNFGADQKERLSISIKEQQTMKTEELMRRAIALAVDNVQTGGGPFGAVIVRDGEIVATGVNRVTLDNDPTAHAEVSAIRAAASVLGTFDLSGCEIYTSCEPCPMCLGAIYWARLERVYYACDQKDAASAGFDDAFIYRELALDKSCRQLEMARLLSHEALSAFEAWRLKRDKTPY